MPRSRIPEQEKIKDFKGTLIRLFKNLENWRYLLIVSIVLAMLAATLSTIAPNKLADVTDVITEGIKPHYENITIINEEIIKHANIPRGSYNNSLSKEQINSFINLDKNKQLAYFNDFKFKNKYISKEDQVTYLSIISEINNQEDSDEILKKLDKIPSSIKYFIEPKLDMSKLKYRALILAIIYLLNSIFGYIEGFIMAYVGIGYSKKLRKDISNKINKLPL
ncbi:MAG: hypothetical protein IJI22_02670 [Bacilli bacterium]|nr:hypothetical protein [Bacilli bacterium]